eukprot:s1703_g14.t1
MCVQTDGAAALFLALIHILPREPRIAPCVPLLRQYFLRNGHQGGNIPTLSVPSKQLMQLPPSSHVMWRDEPQQLSSAILSHYRDGKAGCCSWL